MLNHLCVSKTLPEGYWIQSIRALSLDEASTLGAVLNVPPIQEKESVAGLFSDFQVIAPRKDTQSPWSSKTTDLLKALKLPIARIERFKLIRKEEAAQYDPLTESIIKEYAVLQSWWEGGASSVEPLRTIPLTELREYNQTTHLGLTSQELTYVENYFTEQKRSPTEVELMMFAQANSEHCRHKLFNRKLSVNGQALPNSLFNMIRYTSMASPDGLLSAYHDNAAVFALPAASFSNIDETGKYTWKITSLGALIKVETHNHPTAICPYPGAATGTGGELRDEGATGRGGKPRAGLVGFSVSSWRGATPPPVPNNIASPFRIMVEAPLGAANYGNEFGRPTVVGYFRSFSQIESDTTYYGYHKPIMLAGGIGVIPQKLVNKVPLSAGDKIVVLGGPAMRIGLGGGALSSAPQGASHAELDFASVQRDNAELARRCQEVINRCIGAAINPIKSIHDVGAGGLSNAIPEIIHESDKGAVIDLALIPTNDPTLNALEIWCNEAQERFIVGLAPESLPEWENYCRQECAPFAVVGTVTDEPVLMVQDTRTDIVAVNVELGFLLGKVALEPRDLQDKIPRPLRGYPLYERGNQNVPLVSPLEKGVVEPQARPRDFAILIHNTLSHPTVAEKRFLITIGDRSVGGLTVRDQMVGPKQVPVADCAVLKDGFDAITGIAMAIGERGPVALIDPIASAQLAVGEAITNIAGARIANISDIRMSGNWMAVNNSDTNIAALAAAVETVALKMCPALGIAIPVGKDSVSMESRFEAAGKSYQVTSPMTLVVSAFAPVTDISSVLTPELQNIESELWSIDLGDGKSLGGSIAEEVFLTRHCEQSEAIHRDELHGLHQSPAPRHDEPLLLKSFFECIQQLHALNLITAYHDRSDGGFLATLSEMAFASTVGLNITIPDKAHPLFWLFNEALGAIIQVPAQHATKAHEIIKTFGLTAHTQVVAKSTAAYDLVINHQQKILYSEKVQTLRTLWSETSFEIERARDNPDCVSEYQAAMAQGQEPTLWVNHHPKTAAPLTPTILHPPKMAVLRDVGTNGHVEMARAFSEAGFEVYDVPLRSLVEGGSLQSYQGIALAGGFSYGDVLGAGSGVANLILHNPQLREMFQRFFADPARFTLGVCNGCQIVSRLKSIIPGAEHWPEVLPNRSGRFEARFSMVEVMPSPSVLLSNMAGSALPIVVAHGEGRINTPPISYPAVLRFITAIDKSTVVAHAYPSNPSGSEAGVTGFCNVSGTVTALMPHPERVYDYSTWSWRPQGAFGKSPWFTVFANARSFVG